MADIDYFISILEIIYFALDKLWYLKTDGRTKIFSDVGKRMNTCIVCLHYSPLARGYYSLCILSVSLT